jgi:hypothetical protein
MPELHNVGRVVDNMGASFYHTRLETGEDAMLFYVAPKWTLKIVNNKVLAETKSIKPILSEALDWLKTKGYFIMDLRIKPKS